MPKYTLPPGGKGVTLPAVPPPAIGSEGEITHNTMADYLLQTLAFKTFKDTEEVLVYDTPCGLYRYKAEAIIKELAEGLLVKYNPTQQGTKGYMSEVVGHIQRRTYIDREDFNSQPHLINVENGILDLNTMQLNPHSSYFLSTIRVPVEYHKEAECPLINSFFKQIVAPEDVALLEEIVGWCLDSGSGIQRLILLLGTGANGKSVFLELLRRFLGRENCSAVPLQSFSTNRFSQATLYGKLANIFADLPTTSLSETASIKTLTGGDTVRGEKKFRDDFFFQNKAKLIYSANKPPRIPDDNTLADWRRWILIKFPNLFLGNKADKNLIHKLTSGKELSGLLNIALEGLERLRTQGDFSYNPTWEQTKNDYLLQSDPTSSFLDSRCEIVFDAVITKAELYNAFINYCAEKNIPLLPIRAFGHRLKGKNIVSEGRSDTGETWIGVKLGGK